MNDDVMAVYRQMATEAARKLAGRAGLLTPPVVWEVVGDMQIVLMDKVMAMGCEPDHQMVQLVAEMLTEQFCVESAKVEPMRDDWVRWNRDNIGATRDNGMILMPLRGLAVRKKPGKVLLRVAQLPSYMGSRTQVINSRVWKHLGFTEDAVPDAVKTPAEFIAFLQTQTDVAKTSYVDPAVVARLNLMVAFGGLKDGR